MVFFRGIGARKEPATVPGYRGTTPVEVRKDLAGLIASTGGVGARAGVLTGAPAILVTGNADYSYSLLAHHVVTSKSAADGVQIFGNDGTVNIAVADAGGTLVQPGTGSRIDILYVLHPDGTAANASSEPIFGCARGTASGSPIAPAIPAGAQEYARNTMTSSATAGTAGPGNSIIQTFPWTGLRGAPIPCRNQGERDTLVPFDGLSVDRLDTHVLERHNGTSWRKVSGSVGLVERGQADFSGALILGTATSTPTTLISVPFTLGTAAAVKVDLDLILKANPGSAYAWIDIFIDAAKVRSRQALNNTVIVMDAGAHFTTDVAAGAHTLRVDVTSANAGGQNMSFNTGLVGLYW